MRPLILSAALSLVAGPSLAQDYPFVGTWDCGVALFSMSDRVFNDGTRNFEIASVTVRGPAYVLGLADGTILSMTVDADGALTWLAPATGERHTCAKVG